MEEVMVLSIFQWRKSLQTEGPADEQHLVPKTGTSTAVTGDFGLSEMIKEAPKGLQQSLESKLAKFRTSVRVGCFAANPNSVLMWSHYANQHTGICVEFSGFSMLSSAKFLELLHPVRYTEKLFNLFWRGHEFLATVDLDQFFSPISLSVLLALVSKIRFRKK
jgi:hypothetical protein